VDFFEDELALNGYDWQKILNGYLFQGKEPLVNCLVSGLGHPLIHLGYAYELSSRELAMEALAMAATSYNFLHKYLDDPSYSNLLTYSAVSPSEILKAVSVDKRFDSFTGDFGDVELLFQDHEDAILEHWNAWILRDAKEQFKESQAVAASLLAGTQTPKNTSYDFFLAHILTSSHATRILLPLVPTKHQTSLIRQWWLLALVVFVIQGRPIINEQLILSHDVAGKRWDWVRAQATEGRWSADAHFVKALRALRDAATTWGDQKMFYLKSAVKLCDEFNGWSFQH